MRKAVIILAVFGFITCLLLWWHRYAAERRQTSQQPRALVTNSPEAAENPPSKHALPGSVIPATDYATSRAPTFANSNEAYEFLLSRVTAPIEFYGKVVDENTNPVAGANVTFEWEEGIMMVDGRQKSRSAQSDVDGLFSLHGVRGAGLDVKVGKLGYYTSRRQSSGGDLTGPESPVIFYLRKKGKGEHLVETDYPGFAHFAQLSADGTPVDLDLFKGVKVPVNRGQFKLEFWREMSAPNARTYDWRLQLSIPGGGLLATDEEFAFEAPQIGYQPSVVIDMPATNQDWHCGDIRSKYFVHLPDGNYGRIDFYFLVYNGVFTVKSAINPTGSRNLETE